MDPIRERALRRELRNALTTRPNDVAAIREQLGEHAADTRVTNRGGSTADRAAAKPRKNTKPSKASAVE
jgi:hypothetical protein